MKSSADVSSPTFTIQQIYEAGELELHHFDFYRLGSDPGIVAMQLAESIEDHKAVTVVEWGQTVDDVLPQQRIIIEFTATVSSPDERQITMTYPQNHADLIEKLENQSSRG